MKTFEKPFLQINQLRFVMKWRDRLGISFRPVWFLSRSVREVLRGNEIGRRVGVEKIAVTREEVDEMGGEGAEENDESC